jgi:hypothetical protein
LASVLFFGTTASVVRAGEGITVGVAALSAGEAVADGAPSGGMIAALSAGEAIAGGLAFTPEALDPPFEMGYVFVIDMPSSRHPRHFCTSLRQRSSQNLSKHAPHSPMVGLVVV